MSNIDIETNIGGHTIQSLYKGDLEIYDHLGEQIGPITEGIIRTFIYDRPNPNILVPVMFAGLSLSGKTTALSQMWEKINRDERVKRWRRNEHIRNKFYFLDTGMVREVATNIGVITSEQGQITKKEYQGLSDLSEELVMLGMEYLQGPGQLALEFVWVTAKLNSEGKTIGIPRGSLRLAQRLLVNSNGRMILITAPEDLKDETGETREQARHATGEQIMEVVNKAGVKHSAKNPEEIQAHYMLASNQATRIQQNHDVALLVWRKLPDDQRRSFGSLKSFETHYLKHAREEWEQKALGYYENWMETMFGKPFSHIDLTLGKIVRNSQLQDDENEDEDKQLKKIIRHLYDERLSKAGMIKALVKRSEQIDSGSLKHALRRFELEKLKIYSLT